MTLYGALAGLGFLDQFQNRRYGQDFTVVGYGLNKVLPKADFGGDVRFRGNTQLVTLRGAFGPMESWPGSRTTAAPCTKGVPVSAIPADRRSSVPATSW
jgi:hypothetical protein